MVIAFLFILPIILCIGYFLYKQKEYFFEWFACLFFYYIILYAIAGICQDPDIKHTDSVVSKQGVKIYEYSNPLKKCPWGGTYYTVISTDSVKPKYNDGCTHCRKTYIHHGEKGKYKDESEYEREYNWSILVDYATSGNN